MNHPSPAGSTNAVTLCHDDRYCCKFVYGFEQLSTEEMSYIYAAVVYHGTRKASFLEFGVNEKNIRFSL